MSSPSVKSMKELMDQFLSSPNRPKSNGCDAQLSLTSDDLPNSKSLSSIQDEKLEKVLLDLFTESCLPYFKYGYSREGTVIVGIKNASWATRLKLLQTEIIRRYNQELKSAMSANNNDSYNEKTLITRMVIKVSPY